jgi:hypothetical protein
MIRACATTAGSIVASLSQLTHLGFSLVPTFLHQVSSGWAPMPCTARILGACQLLTHNIHIDDGSGRRFTRWSRRSHRARPVLARAALEPRCRHLSRPEPELLSALLMLDFRKHRPFLFENDGSHTAIKLYREIRKRGCSLVGYNMVRRPNVMLTPQHSPRYSAVLGSSARPTCKPPCI